MNWYLAKIVYRILCGSGQHTPQFDEQLRLIAAGNTQEAFEKAQQTGFAEQEVFCNNKQELVRWEFIGIAGLHSLNGLIDGAELYSRITEVEDAATYVHMVQQKAASIRENSTSSLIDSLA